MLLLHAVPGIAAKRVLLVGLGKAAEFTAKAYADAVRAAVRTLNAGGAADAVLYLAEEPVPGRDRGWSVSAAVAACAEAGYRFDQLKSRKDNARKGLARIAIGLTRPDGTADGQALRRGEALAKGVALA